MITTLPDGKRKVTWNLDFSNLSVQTGENVGFGTGTPLRGVIHANRLIWSAANLSCDLFVPRPMSILVGNKLNESMKRFSRTSAILDELEEDVEFPDVRYLINNSIISLYDVLEIRKKATRFRGWLQEEAERDRKAILAYHLEITRELHLTNLARKSFRLFGVIAGGALGSYVEGVEGGVKGAVFGSALGEATGFVSEIASRIGSDWKPVIFGEWLSKHVETLDRRRRRKRR